MHVKMLLFLLLIVLLSKGHSQLNIELKGGEETAECSNDTGRMKFTTEFASSSNEDLISYFLLPLKDGTNQTNYSICMLSLFKDSTQEEPHPSQDEPKYSDESQKPLASGSEIEPSQNPQSTNENENDIGDEEIVLQLEKIRKNNENGLKNIFGNKEEINETQTYIKYILYYQMITILYENSLTFQNIEEKVLLNLNESLSKLFEMNYENIYEKIKDFNISEIKIQLNNSICKYKQKIIEISNLLEPLKGMINGTNILNELKEFAEKQNLYQLFNKSKDNIIDYIKKNMNSSTLNEKIVEDLDNVLTKLINYSIKNMDIYEFIFKDSNCIKHRIDDILNIFEKNKDKLKIAFKNITKQNKVLEKMMTKIIEDLFNSTKEIENFKNLNICEIFFNSVNNSNLKEMIECIKSIFDRIKNFTLIFESDNITKAVLEQKEDLEKTVSELKNKIQTLNNTNLNKEIERLEELNNKIFKKLNESETRKIIENFIKNIKQLKNTNKVFIYEIINNITERLNKANVTEISNILINLIQSNNRIIKCLENMACVEAIFNEFKEQMKKNNTNEDIKDKINSLKKSIEKYMEENELLKPIYSNFVEYKNEFNKDLISSGALETIKNFSNIKEIIEKLNNLDVNKPEELNETINNIVEKFVSLNISNEIKRIMEFNSQLSNAIKDLNEYIKKDINSCSLETCIKKVKETIHSNIYNISMFINEYKNLSSKIEEIKNILSSLNNTKLNSTTIENIQTLQKNINSNIQKSIEKLLEIIENNNNAGKKRVEDLKNLMNNTVLFSGLKPILDQLDGIYSDYSKNFNKNEIIEKIKEIIQINISNIINNNTEFKEELNHKREELNKYLLSLKDKYISNIKNTSKIENMIKSFDESVRKQSDIINNRFNLTRIIKELNQTLDKEAKDNKLLEIAINLNTNIEKFINIIRNHDDIDKKKLEEVLQNITQNIKNSQVLISQKMNESLYSCNNEWIDNLINDENLQKVVDDFKDIYLKINFTYNKENIKKYLDMFINDIDNITKSIFEDNDLKKDLNKLKEYLNKTKKNIENIDYIKKFLDNINITRNRLNDISKNIAELLKESLNASKILSSFNDIDKIQKFINKSKVEILSDLDNIIKAKTNSEKLKYLINKDNKIFEYLDKIFENKINNSKAEVEKYISELEKLENRIKEFDKNSSKEEYEKTKEKLNEKLKGLNISEKIDILNKTISENFKNIKDLIDLINKKYNSLPDDKSKIELTKRIIKILIDQQQDIYKDFKDFLGNTTFKKYFDKFDIMFYMNNSFGINITDIYEKLIGQLDYIKEKSEQIKNITQLINDLENEIKTILKNETIRNRLKEIFNKNEVKKLLNSSLDDKIRERIKDTKIANQINKQISEIKSFFKNVNASVYGDLDAIRELLKYINNIEKNPNFQNLNSLFNILDPNDVNDRNILSHLSSLIGLFNKVNKTISEFTQISDIFKKIKNNGFNSKRYLSKIKNIIRRMETSKLECRLDDSIPEGQVLSLSPENFNNYIIKTDKNINYNIKISSNINIKNNNKEKCDTPSMVKEIKNNIKFNNNTNFTIDYTKRRFQFVIKIKFLKTISLRFFYLKLKVRLIKRLISLRFLDNELDKGEEVDTYCIPDNSSKLKDDISLNCNGYSNIINEQNKNNKLMITNIKSDYINISENTYIYEEENRPIENNSTENTDNHDTNVYHYLKKSKSSGLSGGAIAGIIIGSVASVAIIVTLIICLRKKPNKIDNNSTTEMDLKIPNSN